VSISTILYEYREAFLRGLLVTLELAAIVWGIGLAAGILVGAAAARYSRAVGMPFRASAFILASIPAIALLMWAHYPAQTLLGVVVDPFVTASIVLTAVNAVGVGETVRSSLREFPRGLVDAARVAGMSERDTLRHIQLPLLSRAMAPALLQQQVVMLHATLFASLISVEELFRVAQRVNAQVYRPVEVFSALAIFFLLICLPLNVIAELLARRWRFRGPHGAERVR
jgi:polar amino acid transport system permease protein